METPGGASSKIHQHPNKMSVGGASMEICHVLTFSSNNTSNKNFSLFSMNWPIGIVSVTGFL